MIAAAEPVGAPTDRDALLRQAIDLRAARRAPEALAVLDRLQGLHPRFSRALQERGHCHVLLGDAPSALKALGEAVRLNPSLPASWDMLEQLHRMRGETGPADGAAQRLAMLRRLPPEIVAADSLLADGDLAEAETVIRDVLYRQGPSAGALRLLARIRQACGDAEEAETLLEGVLASAPDYEAARFDYAVVFASHACTDNAAHVDVCALCCWSARHAK